MAKKKNYEFREKDYSRNSEGLKQRRLKNESRWKYNPNSDYVEDESLTDEEDWFQDPDFDETDYRWFQPTLFWGRLNYPPKQDRCNGLAGGFMGARKLLILLEFLSFTFS